MHAMTALEGEGDPPEAPLASEGFDAFYEREYRPLCRVALAFTGSPAVAEDLVQETLLRAYRHWGKVSGYDQPGAWARRVLCNLATSRGRRLSVEARGLLRMRSDTRHAQIEERDDELWAAVRRLPKREAHAVVLFYVEQLSVQEIGHVLECPEGTVKSLLHRARKSLAAQLREVER